LKNRLREIVSAEYQNLIGSMIKIMFSKILFSNTIALEAINDVFQTGMSNVLTI
jgi:hypothetical protein